MAIKGKSKPRARRSVTPGPRPVYVPVKRPLVQRRGFQIGVLAVVVLVAAGAIVYGFVREREQNHQREQKRLMRVAASSFSVQAQGALSGLGQPIPPGGAFSLLPDLKTDIKDLRSGSLAPAQAAKAAKGFSQQARAGADALGKLDPAKIVGGKGIEDAAFVRDLINARVKMESGLRMQAQAADLLALAAEAGGGEVKALLDASENARSVGETVFSSGYTDWVNAQYTAGIFQPIMPSNGGVPVPGAGAPGAGS